MTSPDLSTVLRRAVAAGYTVTFRPPDAPLLARGPEPVEARMEWEAGGGRRLVCRHLVTDDPDRTNLPADPMVYTLERMVRAMDQARLTGPHPDVTEDV